MAKKIGFFTWQPGLHSDQAKDSAGGAAWTRFLFDNFIRSGYEIIWLTDNNPPSETRISQVEECDIIFLCWRWQMPEYPERNELYLRQMEILSKANDANIRVVIHDEDHKISDLDLEFMRNRVLRDRIILTTPEIYPRDGFKTLFFPNPHTKMLGYNRGYPFMTEWAMTYVGNVYERYEQAVKFFAPFSVRHKTRVFGNWLEPGPGRPGEKKVRNDMPHVRFPGRLSQGMISSVMMESSTTVHLFKESYAKTGFMTMRWAEAAASGVPAFVPDDFNLDKKLYSVLRESLFIVSDGEEMAKNYDKMTDKQWVTALSAQQLWVTENMKVDNWMNFIKEL